MMTAQRKQATNDLAGIGLQSLLEIALRARPDQIFIRSPAQRGRWTDPAPEDLSFAALDRKTRHLAELLKLSRLPPGSAAFIAAPLGLELHLAFSAALTAGLMPRFVPVTASAADIQGLMDQAGPSLALGVGRCGELEPALALRDAAARSFNARLVCGFGSDLPEGVVPMQRIIDADKPFPETAKSAPAGPVTLGIETAHGGTEHLVESDIVSAALDIGRLARLSPDSRILSMMTSASLASLASGPYLALLTGCELLPLGLFSLQALWAGLSDGKSAWLVAPAGIEDALAGAGLLTHASVAGVIFAHREGLPATAAKRTARIVDIAVEGGALRCRVR